MRRARSVTDFVRDVQVSKRAQADYWRAAAEISDLASEMRLVGDNRRAREFSQLAFIASNAARAEFFDPDPTR